LKIEKEAKAMQHRIHSTGIYQNVQ